MRQRIVLFGVGGVGGFLAGRLLAAGCDVALVTGNPGVADALREHGLVVRERGEHEMTVHPRRIFTTAEEAATEGPYDAAWLTMKADRVLEGARSALPLVGRRGHLVTFQNGIVEDDVRAVSGDVRVVAATVGWGATMHRPGIYEKTSPGRTYVGELDGTLTDRLRRLAAWLRFCTPVTTSRNIRGVKWAKLAINATINPLGGLTGLPLGELVAHPGVPHLVLALYSETLRTARAARVTLERVAAPPALLYLPPGASALRRRAQELVVHVMGRQYGGARSSLLQSLERGRKTEIDALNGYVVARATELGVEVPLNRTVVELVHELESGARAPGLSNLEPLVALLPP